MSLQPHSHSTIKDHLGLSNYNSRIEGSHVSIFLSSPSIYLTWLWGKGSVGSTKLPKILLNNPWQIISDIASPMLAWWMIIFSPIPPQFDHNMTISCGIHLAYFYMALDLFVYCHHLILQMNQIFHNLNPNQHYAMASRFQKCLLYKSHIFVVLLTLGKAYTQFLSNYCLRTLADMC